uniref:DUF3778 domain-containing protein n=1 Tax=Oryza meridionalis TaxID=40149 RepID=A0A0E0CTQ7_9ORYZ
MGGLWVAAALLLSAPHLLSLSPGLPPVAHGLLLSAEAGRNLLSVVATSGLLLFAAGRCEPGAGSGCRDDGGVRIGRRDNGGGRRGGSDDFSTVAGG